MTWTDTSSFERDVTRALWAGAAAGALTSLIAQLIYVHRPALWPLLCTAVLVAFAVGTAGGRIALAIGALLAPVAGAFLFFGLPAAALAGAVTGGVLVWARLADSPESPQSRRFWRIVAGLFAGALLAVVAELAGRVFVVRLHALGAPEILAMAAAGAAGGLFLSLSSLPAHLSAAKEVLAARARALCARVTEERLRDLLDRAMDAHRGAARLVAALPRDAARAELAGALDALVAGMLDQAELCASGAEGDVHPAARAREEVARLEAELGASGDAVVRQHLEVALEVAREERQRMADFAVERARLWARLEAEVALLCRARASLEDVRGGHAALRGAELTGLARRLAALSRSQALEADVMAEVAVGAELDQLAGARALRASGEAG